MPDPVKYPPYPRVQFRTNGNLTNASITGAATTALSPSLGTVMELKFGMRVMDFVSTYQSGLQIKLTDNYRRRWYGTEDLYVDLRHMSVYPGSGIPTPWRYNRVLDNPTLPYSVPGDPFSSNPADTLLTVNVVKTIAATRELSLAALCTGNWLNDVIRYPAYMTADGQKGEDYWKMVHTIAVEHFAPYAINVGPTAGVTTQVVTLDAPGDLFLYGCYYTGGANIMVEVNRANQNTAAGLTTNPLRIDMLGPVNGAQVGWHWPGMFFVKMGDQLQVTINSLQPLVDISESLTFVGKRIDPYDMARYMSWMEYPSDYFLTPVGNTQ